MFRRSGLLLMVGLSLLVACTEDDGPDDDFVDITIIVRAVICVPQATGDLRDCGDVGLPEADVTVTSNGATVWEGKTDSEGNAEARFAPTGDYNVTAMSDFIPETLESGPTSPDPALLNVNLFSDELYVLTPLSELPDE